MTDAASSAGQTDALEAQMLPFVVDLIDATRAAQARGMDAESVAAVLRVMAERVETDPLTFATLHLCARSRAFRPVDAPPGEQMGGGPAA